MYSDNRYGTKTSYGTYAKMLLATSLMMAIGIYGTYVLQNRDISPSVTPIISVISSVTSHRTVNDATQPWAYDFGTLPDGAPPKDDWNFEVGTKTADYNNEQQTYTSRPENVRIENGVLTITAKPDKLQGRNYSSARINTKDTFAFTYGTFEAEMMLPTGTGSWPAAWLMPNGAKYQPQEFGLAKTDRYNWALNGEIDFAEAIGSLPGQNIPTIHSYNELHHKPTYTPVVVGDASTAFHRYGVIKTPDKITFTLDGVPYASREKTSNNPLDWPYDQPYYLILNLAVGGNWAGDNGIDNASAPWQLKVRKLEYRPL